MSRKTCTEKEQYINTEEEKNEENHRGSYEPPSQNITPRKEDLGVYKAPYKS